MELCIYIYVYLNNLNCNLNYFNKIRGIIGMKTFFLNRAPRITFQKRSPALDHDTKYLYK